MSLVEIGEQLDISDTSVSKILADPEIEANISEEQMVAMERGIGVIALKRAYQNQKALTPEKMREMSGLQNAIASKIFLEQHRLIANKSTANVSHRGVMEHITGSVEDIKKRLDSLQ